MSNFFEQELRKLFEDGTIIQSPRFVGHACLGVLDKDLCVRVQFVMSYYSDNYDVLEIYVLNRTSGLVDSMALMLADMWDVNQKDRDGNIIKPHIRVYQDKPEWYIYQPTQADREKLREAVSIYLDVFREQALEREPVPLLQKNAGRTAKKRARDER